MRRPVWGSKSWHDDLECDSLLPGHRAPCVCRVFLNRLFSIETHMLRLLSDHVLYYIKNILLGNVFYYRKFVKKKKKKKKNLNLHMGT